MGKIPIYDFSTGSHGEKIHHIKRGSLKIKKLKHLKKEKQVFRFSKRYRYPQYPSEEYAYLIALNNDYMPIGISEISHGTVNMTPVCAREVLIRSLLMGASSVILIHNHVSGSATPSRTDELTTMQIREASMMIGIPMHMHLIIAGDSYCTVMPKKINRKEMSLETITLDLRTLFAAFDYEIKDFSYDIREGNLWMETPEGSGRKMAH